MYHSVAVIIIINTSHRKKRQLNASNAYAWKCHFKSFNTLLHSTLTLSMQGCQPLRIAWGYLFLDAWDFTCLAGCFAFMREILQAWRESVRNIVHAWDSRSMRESWQPCLWQYSKYLTGFWDGAKSPSLLMPIHPGCANSPRPIFSLRKQKLKYLKSLICLCLCVELLYIYSSHV